jgi:hypothetical protein
MAAMVVGGFLADRYAATICFRLDAATFLASGALLLFLRPPSMPRREQSGAASSTSPVAEIAAGVRYARVHRHVIELILRFEIDQERGKRMLLENGGGRQRRFQAMCRVVPDYAAKRAEGAAPTFPVVVKRLEPELHGFGGAVTIYDAAFGRCELPPVEHCSSGASTGERASLPVR